MEVTSRTSTGPRPSSEPAATTARRRRASGAGAGTAKSLPTIAAMKMQREIAAKHIAREFKRIDRGKIRLDETVCDKAGRTEERTGRGRSAIWGTMMSHLIHGWRSVGTGADGKVDAEQDERDEHPLKGEDLPEDGEGGQETGKVSGYGG